MRLHSRFRSLRGLLRGPVARLRREDGISLLMVMGFVLIFSITTSAIVIEVTSNEKSAGRDDKSSAVFNLAEAALNIGIDRVNTELDPNDDLGDCTSPSTSCPGWARYEDLPGLSDVEKPEWYAEKSAGVWTVHARARRGSTTRELEATLERGVDPDNPDFQAWQGAYSYNEPGTCIYLNNNAITAEEIYTNGDLCLEQNVHIDDSIPGSNAKTKIHVGGDVWLKNNANIGDPGNEVLSAAIGGHCYTGSSRDLQVCSNSGLSRVYALDYLPVDPSNQIEKPPVDLTWYERAAPRPDYPCLAGSYGTFPGTDNDSTRNNSLSNVNLFGSSYKCSTTAGSIEWKSSDHTLTISGVVFVDGNLVETLNSFSVVYSGRGTIYFNGTISFSGNNFHLCPTSSCGAWDPNTNLLLLVVLNNTPDGLPAASPPDIPNTFTITNGGKFQGAAYVIGGFWADNNSSIQGPVIADGLRFGNNAGYFTPLGDDGLPADAPMNPNAWLPKAGSWRQVR